MVTSLKIALMGIIASSTMQTPTTTMRPNVFESSTHFWIIPGTPTHSNITSGGPPAFFRKVSATSSLAGSITAVAPGAPAAPPPAGADFPTITTPGPAGLAKNTTPTPNRPPPPTHTPSPTPSLP